jgi:uncharacterized protein (DUF2062 family)
MELMIFLLALGGTLLLAALHGGRDERTAALAIGAAALLTPLLVSHHYEAPELGVLLVDSLLFAALAAIAMSSRAFWPMWAAGLQLGALAVHLAAAKMPEMVPAAYAETLAIWSYAVLGALAAGTWWEARRERAH